MNKHGQTLILFVILIPLLLVLMGFLIDTSFVLSKKIHLREVTKDVLQEGMNKNDEKIKEMFLANDVLVDNLEIIRKNNELEIKNEMNIKSIFGAIVGIKEYHIRVDYTAVLVNGKINIKTSRWDYEE